MSCRGYEEKIHIPYRIGLLLSGAGFSLFEPIEARL
jgi:hypothetical protein